MKTKPDPTLECLQEKIDSDHAVLLHIVEQIRDLRQIVDKLLAMHDMEQPVTDRNQLNLVPMHCENCAHFNNVAACQHCGDFSNWKLVQPMKDCHDLPGHITELARQYCADQGITNKPIAGLELMASFALSLKDAWQEEAWNVAREWHTELFRGRKYNSFADWKNRNK